MKKTCKKLACIMLAASMVASLAGCSGDAEKSTENNGATAALNESTEIGASSEFNGEIKGKITVLTNRSDLVESDFKRYAAVFEERYPGTEVEFLAMDDYESDTSVLVTVGELGDVCLIPSSISSSEYGNYFEPLGTDDKLAEYYLQEALAATTYDGLVYGLPSGCNVSGIAYNKKVFAAAGIQSVPTTTDEFLEALQAIKDNTDAIPYYTNYHDSWALGQWQSYVTGVSGDSNYISNVMCNEQDPFSEGKPSYQVYKLLYDIVDQGLCESDPVSSDWEASKEMINNGEIACMAVGSWAVNQFKEAGSNPDDIGYMPFPVTSDDGTLYQTLATDYAYAIPKTSDNKPTARAFLEFLIGETDYTEVQGMISIVRGSEYPDFLELFEGANYIANSAASVDNKGKWENVNKASELNLTSGSAYQVDIVDTALGQSHRGNSTFDDVMAEWNERWADGILTVEAQ